MAARAGIKLTGIDLEALGLLRAFVEPKPVVATKADDTATVVVAIGHESSTLLVAGGGTCEFTRVFDWGGSALEEAIATALDVRPGRGRHDPPAPLAVGPGPAVRRRSTRSRARRRPRPFGCG